MKLVSGRQYKKDISDVAGIVYEQQIAGHPLTYEAIDKAVCNLYGNWNNITDDMREILNTILACNDLQSLFIELSEDERVAKEALIEMVQKYPTVLKRDNVNDVVTAILKKKKTERRTVIKCQQRSIYYQLSFRPIYISSNN